MGSGQVDVPDYASTDKDILDGALFVERFQCQFLFYVCFVFCFFLLLLFFWQFLSFPCPCQDVKGRKGRDQNKIKRGDAHQVRILDVLNDGYVVKLEVQVLINALEGAADLDAVLELNGDLDVDQRLEETVVLPTSTS